MGSGTRPVQTKLLYDWESAATLVRKESARRIGLQAVRAPARAVKGYKGEVVITDSNNYLPFLAQTAISKSSALTV